MNRRNARLTRVNERPKLADEVTETLRQAILQGVYEKDAKLGMEELAEELGVSIMPVREALITLSNEGLVVTAPRRGFRANPLAEDDLGDIFEIQSHLAGILAARAVEEATDDDIAQLRTLHENFIAATKLPHGVERSQELGNLNTEFHRVINKIPSGDRVRWFLRLTNRFVRRDLFDAMPGSVDDALEDHPAIIEAFAARDADRARTLMEAHFLQGMRLAHSTEAIEVE